VIHRQQSTKNIPFIKQREATPLSQKSFCKNPAASLRNFQNVENPIFSEDFSLKNSKVPLKIDVRSETFSQNDGDFDDFQRQMNRFFPEQEKSSKNDLEKMIALKYKEKYREKLNEAIGKQNEIHRFEIETIKNQFEGKIFKYKEIIKKLQEDCERLSRNKGNFKKNEVLDPLIEENIWLKHQIKNLKGGK
jgi:hypothetical protein